MFFAKDWWEGEGGMILQDQRSHGDRMRGMMPKARLVIQDQQTMMLMRGR